MEFVEVRTQSELDAALKREDVVPVCVGKGHFAVSQAPRAYGSATVDAYGSATVDAYDSATVDAYDSATVRAYDSATVRAYGSATVRASPFVAIHDHGGPKITGGVVIKVPKPATAEEWCEYRGVKIADGQVVLFKAVRDDWCSAHGMSYKPGSTPVAPDWDGGARECGGGLHFCATVHEARGFDGAATKFLACPIAVEDIAVHKDASMPQKVKARGLCAPCWEVDIDGEPVS